MHLAARSLSYAHGPTTVLAGVDFAVRPGDRIGVVGPNGSGKTTLLRLLAGELVPDGGSVRPSPPGLLVAHLHQEVRPAPGEGVLAYLARRTGVSEAAAELDAATADLAADRPGAADRYSDALERWLGLGGADLESRAAQALHRVGLDQVAVDHPVAGLSGGQKARVDLAAVVLHRAAILLLDEPTNDLDASGLALLADLVGSTPAGVVVVSHDRAFLERVVTEVVELDGHDHTARRYAGGWAGYQRERQLARDAERRAYQGYVEQRDQLVERARRQRGWAERGVRQATKRPSDGDKLLRNAHIARAEARAGDARRTEARLDRLAAVDKPWEPWQLQLRLADQARSGDVVVAASAVVVERGPFRLGPVDVELRFGDRVELAGPNGAGKTTLVDVLLGRLEPTSGWVRRGARVVVGRLGQQRDDIDASADVARAVADASGASMTQVRATLAALGLGPTHLARPPASLSAGERTRALLATFQLRGVNLLVLDEPTNHLDLPAIEQLEHALAGFGGTLLVASHDRRFLDALALTRRLEVDAGTVREA